MPRPTTAARRYAEAVFELAMRDDALDRWRDELQAASELLSDERVASVVDNPAVPFAERARLIDRLLDGRAGQPVRNLAKVLAGRNRVEIVPAVAAEYRRLLNRHRGVAEALVTSAAPLTGQERSALLDRLRAMTGAEVELEEQVDPALIGGLTVRVGDQMLDASVRGRLERLRARLVAGGRQLHEAPGR